MNRGVLSGGLLATVLLAGCASGFGALYPGMTSEQVADSMGRGPSRTEMFDEGYSAWYFGENQCVLMQNNTLVDKHVTERVRGVATPLGGYREKVLAMCVPPGVERSPTVKHSVYSPFGGVSTESQGQPPPPPSAPPGSNPPPPVAPPQPPPPGSPPPPPPTQ